MYDIFTFAINILEARFPNLLREPYFSKKTYMTLIKKHRRKLLGFALLLLVWFFSLPNPLFKDPLSTILLDREGDLLGARIAADGQWRFPKVENVPQKFTDCITTFEDKRFFNHLGVDPIGFARAMQQNIRAGEIVSGGSTLTMQVIRLSRKGKSRTVFEKLIEFWLATRLELTYSKEEILKLYATYAPFGGNVVGLETASWRYFARPPKLLTWSEHATLAVLPNAPSLIHVGRNRKALFEKRNRLLDRLFEAGKIDSITCVLSKEETLPEKPFRLPQFAPHLLDRVYLLSPNRPKGETFGGSVSDWQVAPGRIGKEGKSRFRTTINPNLQKQVTELANRRHNSLKANEIHNLATIVIEVETGEIIAYLGNAPNAGRANGEAVDIIRAPRSTGSILKPFLYAQMLDDGAILPEELINDIPVVFSGYSPENYRYTYDGIVSAKRAVSRSLNVPLVNMLQSFGVEKFHSGLQKIGLTTINRSPDHYGLSLILGGAEANLEEVTSAYASMARTLSHFGENDGEYLKNDWRKSHFLQKQSNNLSRTRFGNQRQSRATIKQSTALSAAAIYHTFEAMREVERPNESGEWERFGGSRQIAWKTGTSFGFRDAWAVGVTPKYAVGVWVGNADGEGRPGLVGVQAAAPILFDIFSLLPQKNEWFDPPFDEMIELPICRESGMRALDICPKDTVWVIASGQKAATCSFHKLIHLAANEDLQVTSKCESPDAMRHIAWFMLPPVQEHFFKNKNPEYRSLPPFRAGCKSDLTDAPMQLIYPLPNSKIYLPFDLDGKLSSVVFKAAHRNSKAKIFWHLDENFMGETIDFHHLELKPEIGWHRIVLVDESGSREEMSFEILGK